jgi:SAM-dependent methyltransferase
MLVTLAIVYLGILFYKKNMTIKFEGFTQTEKFILKRDNEKYDEFYVQVYDKLMKPYSAVDTNLQQIIQMTEPTKSFSVFVNIGSKTGHLTNAIKNEGYIIYGIDNSKEMIAYSKGLYPNLPVKCGDPVDPMAFEHGIISHVLCIDFEIYRFKNKNLFFQNCYYWLKPGGYLILHLVDREKYDPITPSCKSAIVDDPQQYSDERITNSYIDFIDFTYKNEVDFSSPDVVLLKETFTDTQSGHIRQNEETLYMEPLSIIVEKAKKYGFIPKGQSILKSATDEYQYLYILERML